MKNLSAYKRLNKLAADRPAWFIILINVYPIAGVLALGWDYFIIVLLYIIETVIIGIYNAAKMATAKGEINQEDDSEDSFSNSAFTDETGQTKSGCIKVFLIPFFLFHYNFFVAVQSVFVFIISGQMGNRDFSISEILNFDFAGAVLFIILSHGYSFYTHYIQGGEYKKVSPPRLMIQPYKRIFIQQITVIFGTMIIMVTGAPVFFLVLLIILKTAVDIHAHLKLHEVFSQKS